MKWQRSIPVEPRGERHDPGQERRLPRWRRRWGGAAASREHTSPANHDGHRVTPRRAVFWEQGGSVARGAEEMGPRVQAREVAFIRELAGEGLSLVQIGRRLGLTPFAVRGVLAQTPPLD